MNFRKYFLTLPIVFLLVISMLFGMVGAEENNAVIITREPVLTVSFYESETASEPFCVQTLKQGDALECPDYMSVCPEGYGLECFCAEDGTPFTDFGAQIICAENASLRLNAHFTRQFYIFYHDDRGNTAASVPFTEGYKFSESYPAIPTDPDKINTGWNTSPDGSGITYTSESVVGTPEDNLHLYPVLKTGSYVRFSTSGGSPVRSQFILPGEKVSEPSDPTREGYIFDGWDCGGELFDFDTVITEETVLTARWIASDTTYSIRLWLQNTDGTYSYDSSYVRSAVSGSEISFTANDIKASDIYASICSAQSDGGIQLYYLDNKYDSGALTMTQASVSEINENGGIAGNGSTILNVYLRRFTYILTITDNGLAGKGNTLKYSGIPIRSGETPKNAVERAGIEIDPDFYDILLKGFGPEPYAFTVSFPGVSTLSDSSWFRSFAKPENTYHSYKVKLSDGCSFTIQMIRYQKGNTIFSRRRYYQTLDSAKQNNETDYSSFDYDNYEMLSTSTIYRTTGQSSDGFIESSKEGFTLYFIQCIDDDGHTKFKRLYSGELGTFYPEPYRLEVFLKRNSYTVDFETYQSQMNVDSCTVFYQDSLQTIADLITYTDETGTHSFVPGETSYVDEELNTWIFRGWYTTEAFVGDPIDFSETDLTMPAQNLNIYAYWEKLKVDATFDAVFGTIDGQQITVQTKFAGEYLTAPEIPEAPEGFEFYCWTLDGKIFDFSDPINDTLYLIAAYRQTAPGYSVTYSLGDVSGNAPEDSEKYLASSKAIILAPSEGLYDADGSHFIGWSDGERTYFPGEVITIEENKELTAVYASKPGEITIVYNPGIGSGDLLTDLENCVINDRGNVSVGNLSVSGIERNSYIVLSGGNGFEKENFVLKGWNTDAAAASEGVVQYMLNDELMAAGSGTVTLYGVWEEIPGSAETGDGFASFPALILLSICCAFVIMRRRKENFN